MLVQHSNFNTSMIHETDLERTLNFSRGNTWKNWHVGLVVLQQEEVETPTNKSREIQPEKRQHLFISLLVGHIIYFICPSEKY